MKNNSKLLDGLIDHLLLNSSFTKDVGLYHGKMGIAIFFYFYSRYLKSCLYEDFANELLDEVINDINEDLPINFERGLCGIAWSIQYLINDNYIASSDLNIFKNIDIKIMERDPRRFSDLSIETGIGGIFNYINLRMNSAIKSENPFFFDQTYLTDLYEVANAIICKNRSEKLSTIAKTYIDLFNGSNTGADMFKLEYIIPIDCSQDIANDNLGLCGGYAGVGLKIIQTIFK